MIMSSFEMPEISGPQHKGAGGYTLSRGPSIYVRGGSRNSWGEFFKGGVRVQGGGGCTNIGPVLHRTGPMIRNVGMT